MGDGVINNLVSSCGSHSALFATDSFSQPQHSSVASVAAAVRLHELNLASPTLSVGRTRLSSRTQAATRKIFYRTSQHATNHILPELRNSGVVSDTPLLPSHAGSKGDPNSLRRNSANSGMSNRKSCFSRIAQSAIADLRATLDLRMGPVEGSRLGHAHSVCNGLRPVDTVVLPRPSVKEEGKASVSVPSKKGKLYIRFVVAVAIIAAAIYAHSAAASAPVATPAIVNNNASITANASLRGDVQ